MSVAVVAISSEPALTSCTEATVFLEEDFVFSIKLSISKVRLFISSAIFSIFEFPVLKT